ncbi:hypothetical protein BH10BAC2_BH10BAC2_09950 [soil metagenome]
MHSILNNPDLAMLEQELRKERDYFAVAFHRGKSLSDLKEQLTKIRSLEKQLALLLHFSLN